MPRSSQKKLFFSSRFRFDSIACDCEIGVTPISKGIKKYVFHLYPNGDSISFGYKDEKELINTTRNGTVVGRAVLPDLLAIKDGDVDDVKTFIERHGFFLPLALGENKSADAEFVFFLINRLKATFSLLFALGEKEDSIDYEKIMALTLYLLLTPQARIDWSNEFGEHYYTCYHDLGDVWNNISSIEEQIIQYDDPSLQFINEAGEMCVGFFIEDSVRPPHTWLQTYEYDEAVDYGEYYFATMKKKVTFLFRNVTDPRCRLGIDFLYHFCKDVGEIENWGYTGELIFTQDGTSETKRLENIMDEQLKAVLLKLAGQTLQREFEYNLGGIVPVYDTESMVPSWCVRYLLSGLYFSVFNLHPKEEQYRVCAKPNCGRYFLAKNNLIKQRYCCHNCSNAMAQSVRRSKAKEQHKGT